MSPFRSLTLGVAAFALLSFGTVAIANSPGISASGAAQIQALRSLKTQRSVSEQKIGSRLLYAMLHARGDSRLALLTDFRFIKPDAKGQVLVDIALKDADAMKTALNAIEAMGGETIAKSRTYRLITAHIPLDRLDSLAAITAIGQIRDHVVGLTHRAETTEAKAVAANAQAAANVVNALPKVIQAVNVSEGDQTHGADAARAIYGANGTGVKVCVLSDGVDSLATLQASGDLPATVDVLAGQAGSGNEGSAMLEIIHDLAPGADLGFATGNPNQATFAQNILDLASAGCNVIVDDIIYLDESPFQDGPVAQAVNTVTTAGVHYFSSAGNEGNLTDTTSGTWEGDFLASAAADPAPLAGANLHNFGNGGNSILVEAGSSVPVVLTWAESYNLANGSASTDFDIYDMDGGLTTIFDASTDVQDGTGGNDFPVEIIGGGTFAGERLLIDKFAAGTTSSTPMMNLIVFRGEIDGALATAGATRGHSAAANAFSIAATPAQAAQGGPYPGLFTASNVSETFSSDGPRRIILDPAGAELTPGNRSSTGGVVRQKPDITAADGVSTAAPGFNPFSGTSAAAPHAAAIAALIKSAVPAITPAQLRSALISSAIDIETAGVDRSTGAGIVMAQAAMQAAGAPQAVNLVNQIAVGSQVAGDGDAFVETNEDWSLIVPLENQGASLASAISATLSTTTAGVSIYSANSGYADIAGSGSAPNDLPYIFHLDSGFSCGQTIDFVLTVTYTGGPSPKVFNFSLNTGSPGSPSTIAYTGPAVGIPDGTDLSGTLPGAPADAVLPVSVVGKVFDVNLSIDGAACSATAGSTTVGIDHSFVNDLKISLVSPDGTSVLAINQTDGSGNNFCQTALDDQSAGSSIQSVVTANAPFTGSFTPNVALAAFNGKNTNGNWILRAQDFFNQDTGNIRAWSLIVTPSVCNAPVQPAQMTATKTVSGTAPYLEGQAITYTIVLTNNGAGIQPDNAGNEFSDLLPAGLTVGTPTVSAGTVSASGANPVTWNGSLMPGASVTITIPATINAGTSGTPISNQATVNFDADRDGSNEASALSDDPNTGAANDPTVIVVGQGTLTISPPAVAFGNQGINTSSAPIDITLGNSGTASLNVTALTPAAAPFARVGGTCPASAPFAIATGSSCTLSYQFAPTAIGPASQNIAVTADAPGSGSFSLSGTGVQGMLAIAPTLAAFGDQGIGTASAPIDVTLGNSGAASLNVTALTAAATPFARIGGTCPASAPFAIAAGANCTLSYQFAPTLAGPTSQSINVTVDVPGSGSFSLTGNGVQGMLSVSPGALNFPELFVGGSQSADVTIGNTGAGSLQINSISNPAAPFSISGGSCGSAPFTLLPAATCTITIRFDPMGPGVFTDALTVVSDAETVVVSLNGNGVMLATDLPTLSETGLLALGLLLFGFALVTLRNRKRKV